MKKISIIIVNWNTRDYLLNCIEHLRKEENYEDIEIIIVDNDSSDDSIEVISRRFPEAIIIENNENLGFAKANNIGLEKASGKYICLMNSDIEILPNCIRESYEFLEKSSKIGMVGPKILNADLTIQKSCRKLPGIMTSLTPALGLHRIFPNLFSDEDISFDDNKIREVDGISGCLMVVKREALLDVGLLDEQFFMYSEDIDWCRKFQDTGWKIAFLPAASAIHYGGKSSAIQPKRFYVEQCLSRIRYIRKHFGIFYRIIMYSVIFIHYFSRSVLFSFKTLVNPDYEKKMTNNIECIRMLLKEKIT